jgi:uncharacterized protein YkwD
MRYAITVLGAVFLATFAFIALSAADPTNSKAAANGGGYVTTCGGGSLYLNAQEKRTLQLHNQTRAERGLGRLCVHPALTRAARSHSLEMIERDYMSHNSYNGESVDARLRRFGYDWGTYGENVAWGSAGSYASPETRFKAWMKSPGHRANILNGNFREIGIGTATGTFRSYSNATTYTVDFGTRR